MGKVICRRVHRSRKQQSLLRRSPLPTPALGQEGGVQSSRLPPPWGQVRGLGYVLHGEGTRAQGAEGWGAAEHHLCQVSRAVPGGETWHLCFLGVGGGT